MSKTTPRSSPTFVPLGTRDETKTFLLHVSYLRHHTFSTNRYCGDGKQGEQWAWNVTEGYELAKARDGSLGTFDAVENGVDLALILAQYPSLHVRYALNEADTSKPVLFVPVRNTAGGVRTRTLLLIDGWHRLFRSVVEAMETGEPRPLPAYFLTEDEARAIQIAPVEEPLSIPIQPGTQTLRQLSQFVK